MEGFKLKKAVVLSFIIISLLVTSSQTSDMAGNQLISIASLADNQVPIVNSPVDIIYVEGSTGHSITWEISDDNPAYWVTTRNGEYFSGVAWDTLNETVIVDVDGLSVGNYEFMIYACDGIYNITDVVLVSVLSSDIEVHAPISIGSNTQFNTTAQSEGWIGNGTSTNPYIIEKLYIEALSDCISIHGTTVHFVIRNCTFVKTGTDSGIGLDFQVIENGNVENCTFANLWVASINWFISNCTWKSNSFGNLADGIWLNDATSCNITNNWFTSGGISISGYAPSNWIHQISGNTIDGKPIGYFEGLSSLDIVADDYGQIIVANCVDVDILNGNFSNAGSAISIGHSNASDIWNCGVQGGRFGIYLERTRGASINYCRIDGSAEVGMYINETVSTIVASSTIQNIGFVGAQIGMCLDTAIIQTVVENCGDAGIICYDTSNVYISNCTIQENNNGIIIGGCPNSLLVLNRIQYNDEYGLWIQWASDNLTIYENELRFNGVENAYDDGVDTSWDNGYSTGNTWSDYGGVGFYYVPGSGNGIDHYPNAVDVSHGIEVYDTADTSYTVGTTGHSITWETNCTHPSTYSIFKDGVIQIEQLWDGSSIVYGIDGLTVGEYNYTLVIMDAFSDTASDTVFVTVIPTDPTIITNTTTTTTTTNATDPIGMQEITLIISIGSTVVIAIVVILIIRSKKGAM